MAAMSRTPKQPYNAPPVLVVTDLDGTLLDHFTYDFKRAAEALGQLRILGVPLIPNTSKTNAELRPLREKLGNDDPFIVENGSAIFLPRSRFPKTVGSNAFSQDLYLIELGETYRSIVDRLSGLKDEFNFIGFSDMDRNQVVHATGLTGDQAERAMRRRFSEPLLWQDSEPARREFVERLDRMGLHTLQGGRFLHVLGKVDKGMALNTLRSIYEQAFGMPFTVIALGDSINDVAMLEAADLPVIIRSPVHDTPTLKEGKAVTISRHVGPEGWNDTVLNLLSQFTNAEVKVEVEGD